jgi:hypothetical protein
MVDISHLVNTFDDFILQVSRKRGSTTVVKKAIFHICAEDLLGGYPTANSGQVRSLKAFTSKDEYARNPPFK